MLWLQRMLVPIITLAGAFILPPRAAASDVASRVTGALQACFLPKPDEIKSMLKFYKNLATAYLEPLIKFDVKNWDLHFPELTDPSIGIHHHRPAWLVEVVPNAGDSKALAPVSPFIRCLSAALDEHIVGPLVQAVYDTDKPYVRPRGGCSGSDCFFDAHVWKFELDALDLIVGSPANPIAWADPAKWVGGIKPCYFSEIDPLRWRYRAHPQAALQEDHPARFWEGISSPKVGDTLFHPWGPRNRQDGHVSYYNPLWAGAAVAIRAAHVAVHPEWGWGVMCGGEDDVYEGLDRQGHWSKTSNESVGKRQDLPLMIQLVSPVTWTRPMPIGRPDETSDWSLEKEYWPEEVPPYQSGYAFLLWERHFHGLGLDALTGVKDLPKGLDIRRFDDAARSLATLDLTSFLNELSAMLGPEMGKAVDLVRNVLQMLWNLVEEITKHAQGVLINAVIEAVFDILGAHEGAVIVRDVECSADSAWELMTGMTKVLGLGACGKGLSDVREVARVKKKLDDAKDVMDKVYNQHVGFDTVGEILHGACTFGDIHPPIEKIHSLTDPDKSSSAVYKLIQLQKYLDYADAVCLGAKFLSKPTSDPAQLLSMFVEIKAPQGSAVGDLARTLDAFRDPTREVDRVLTALARDPALTPAERTAWEADLRGLKQDLSALDLKAIGDIRNRLDRLRSGDFLKDLAEPLKTELLGAVTSFSPVGTTAWSSFDDLDKRNQAMLKQIERMGKLFDIRDLSGDVLIQGFVAFFILEAEFETLGLTMGQLQQRAPNLRAQFDQAEAGLSGPLRRVADLIRSLDERLAQEITSTLVAFDAGAASSIGRKLDVLGDRALQGPGRTSSTFHDFGRAAKEIAQTLSAIGPKLTALSRALTTILKPVGDELDVAAGHVEKLADSLGGMASATDEMGNLSGVFSTGGEDLAVRSAMTLGAPTGSDPLKAFFAMMGDLARQSRRHQQHSIRWQMAREKAGGPRAPNEELIAEYTRLEGVQRRPGEEGPDPPDKAREAKKLERERLDELRKKIKGEIPLTQPEEEARKRQREASAEAARKAFHPTPEECEERRRTTYQASYEACLASCTTNDRWDLCKKCIKPEDRPCP
ncbi:MAG: hypothetical protein HYY13_01080 [Nitrospirae bacterium]|nr:hypothetical protein [Nitrospirota bacterium]